MKSIKALPFISTVYNPPTRVTPYVKRLLIEQRGRKCENCRHWIFHEVHHIDRDIHNNQLENLKLLCLSCHSKIPKTSYHKIERTDLDYII